MPGGGGEGRPGSILDQGTRSPHAAAKAPAYHNEDSVQSKKKRFSLRTLEEEEQITCKEEGQHKDYSRNK